MSDITMADRLTYYRRAATEGLRDGERLSPDEAKSIILELCEEIEDGDLAAKDKEIARLQYELTEGDSWMQRSIEFQESGNCPVCFGDDEGGHEPGCEWGKCEDERDRLRDALKPFRNSALRQVLHDIYPTIAGRVIALRAAGETAATKEWADIARQVYEAERGTAGASYLRVVEAVQILSTFDDFRVEDDCPTCWPDGVPGGYMAARLELEDALEELAELDGDRHA